VATIKEAAGLDRRARLQLVNERMNAAIRYTNDWTQWQQADVWSAPLDSEHKGSLESGIGDCEDYAIAKYVALRESGVPDSDLRILLVKDNAVHLDHAVLAARESDHWVVLDNRWSRLTDDTQLRQFVPLFALNAEGVKLFAAPYAALDTPNGDSFVAGADAMPDAADAVPRVTNATPSETTSTVWSALAAMLPLL
jgi:predicted transglutaminase-like cysteine proteinase